MISIKKHKNNIKGIIKKIKEDNISEYAAEAAYFTIISFIPFVLFFITLIKFTNIEKDTIFIVLNEIIPSNISNVLLNIIEEVFSKHTSNLSFSLLIIIWSSGKGFFSLSKGIKNIYKVNIKNNFILRIVGCIYTIILVISIMLFLTLLLLGKSIYISIMKKYYQISFIISFIYKLRRVFLIILMTTIFYFLYKIITIKDKKKFSHIYGAIFSAIIWQILSYGISVYMKISNNFSFLYGSLSSLVLIMLWGYFGMYIILLGAEVNKIVMEESKREKRS